MRRRLSLPLAAAFVVAAATLPGCAVRAYEREYLSDPIMSLDTTADEESRELKWLEAREGSRGGAGGAGGGCACN